MGSGVFTVSAYADYSADLGRSFCTSTMRIEGQTFTASNLDESLDPKNFKLRECANSEEHPNTVPVILALDVTGSMGAACRETAEALAVIVKGLYEKIKDVEFCVMGIGDLDYDRAPIQMSQFESDVRIAVALDKIWLEFGGGGNAFESYSAAWWMGLHKTKLDCFDKQGRKGIIITMGDEPLNPYLPNFQLSRAINESVQSDIDTESLYKEASKKFDIFHIAVDDVNSSYHHYEDDIERTFKKVIGDHLRISTIQNLSKTIEECILESVNANASNDEPKATKLNENGEIEW